MPRIAAGAFLFILVVVAITFLLLDADEPEGVGFSDPGQAAVASATEAPEPTRTDAPEPSAPSRLVEQQVGPPDSYSQAMGGLTGRVVDSALVPLPDLKVELMGGNLFNLLPSQEDWFLDEEPDLSFVSGESRTDVEGRFRFDQVDPHGFFLLAVDVGGPRSAYSLVEITPEPGRLIDLGDIVLDPYVTLLGRVVDEDGAPIPDALVRASNLPHEAFSFGLGAARPGCAVGVKVPPSTEWMVYPLPSIANTLLARLPYHQTRTGSDGTFRLEGVPIGTVTVLADQDGFVPLVRGPWPTGAEGERTVADLVLEEGSVLTGLVVDGDDLPVPNAIVMAGTLLPIFPVSLLLPGGRTDAEGRFRIDGLPDQSHAVAVRAADATAWKVVDGLDPGFDEPVIRLGSTGSITVTALDAQSEVVRHPKVMVQLASELGENFLLAPPLPLMTRRHELEDGSVRISGLSPGTYHVNVLAKGYAALKEKVELERGGQAVKLHLEQELTGSVQVVTKADREPVEYALVSVYLQDAGQENPFDMAPLLTRRTDRNGIAFLEGLVQGELNVRVFHPAYALGEAGLVAPGPPVQVELSGGGSLSGFVLRDGQPVTKPHWVLTLPAGEEDLKLPRLTRTDATGAYRLTHLRPGSYGVMVRDKLTPEGGGGPRGGGGGSSFTFSTSSGHDEQEEEKEGQPADTDNARMKTDFSGFDGDTRVADITEGEETRLDIDLLRMEGSGPRGRLLGSMVLNGRPAQGYRVVVRQPGAPRVRRSAETNQRGIFDLGDVPAEELVVEVSEAGDEEHGVLAARRIQVAPSDVANVEFQIETGWLEGQVRSAADGRPVAYASLRLLSNEDEGQPAAGGSLVTASDDTGAFRFESVPAGAWLLMAERQGFARTNLGPLQVPGRGKPPSVTVRLETSVSVAGRIELPEGAGEAPYLFVHFSSDDSKQPVDFRGFAFVEPETRRFKIDDLAPGNYRVGIMGATADLEPVELVVPSRGLPDATLRPKLAAPAMVIEPVETGGGG